MADRNLQPLAGGKLAFAAVVLSLANFMVVLDTTITNVAMPTISGDLGVSTTEGTWIITAYAVAEAITIPLTGWLSRRFGQVRVFTTAVVAFVIFSICCGLSGSLGSLVLFRVLQGLAGGPLIPLSSTLLLSVFPKQKSNIALSLWGMMTVVAPIFGPIFGGLISDNWSWSWIFYINIGFGIFVGLGAWSVLKGRETATELSRIDAMGLALLVVFVTAFQVMLEQGRELDWFSSNLIIVCAIVSVVALAALIIWELTDADPVIDLSVFKSRNWLVSTVVLSLATATDGLHRHVGGLRHSPDGNPRCADIPIDWPASSEGRPSLARQLWDGRSRHLVPHAGTADFAIRLHVSRSADVHPGGWHTCVHHYIDLAGCIGSGS